MGTRAFTIGEKLKQGDLSEIFVAVDEESGRALAMKRMLPFLTEDEDFRQMFVAEARLLWRLSHPNIPTLHHAATTVERPYFLMQFVDGCDVRELLQQQGQLPVGVVAYIGACIASALAHVHQLRDEKNVWLRAIHREVCPENIMLSNEGDVFLVGFGLCKFIDRTYSTKPGILKGKFNYMSPEQVRGLPLDLRSDIFGLGVTLYEALTNHKAFQGQSDFDTLEQVRAAKVKPITELRRDIPEELVRIVHTCLAPKPDERYPSASHLEMELRKVADEEIPSLQQAATLAALMVR